MSYAKPYIYNGASEKKNEKKKKIKYFLQLQENKVFSTLSNHDPCFCIPQNAWYVTPDLLSTISATRMKPLECVSAFSKHVSLSKNNQDCEDSLCNI